MKTFWRIVSTVLFATFFAPPAHADVPASLYDLSFNDLKGAPFDTLTLKGKVILVVNVASNCGFTRQYEGLQDLYEAFKDKGLVIVGVPSNDFNQESGSEKEIASFCKLNYGVTFPLTEKMHVKPGEDQHPLYVYLSQSNPKVQKNVSWNFNKFLVDKNGKVVAHYGSWVKPQSSKLRNQILELL